MIPKKKLNEYCESRLLKFEIDENILIVNGKEYEIIDNEATIFDENFNVIPESKYSETGIVYEFCGRWYLQEFGESEAQMNELKYLGETTVENKTETFLGVHTGNELLNAVGGVKNWIQKASFLGVKNLGIVERKNLSAILEFQTECNKAGIKPITGMTVPVKKGESTYEVKLYAKNFQGWQTLLKAKTF
jgi:DNA polymerase-3 subunit alpha